MRGPLKGRNPYVLVREPELPAKRGNPYYLGNDPVTAGSESSLFHSFQEPS